MIFFVRLVRRFSAVARGRMKIMIDSISGGSTSEGAVSEDGRRIAVLTPNTGLEKYKEQYVLVTDGKIIGEIDTSRLKCDSIRRIKICDDLLLVSVIRNQKALIEVWTFDRTPRETAEFEADYVVDRAGPAVLRVNDNGRRQDARREREGVMRATRLHDYMRSCSAIIRCGICD